MADGGGQRQVEWMREEGVNCPRNLKLVRLGVAGARALGALLGDECVGLVVTDLDLYACGIEEEGALAIAEGLAVSRRLVALSLSGPNALTGRAIEALLAVNVLQQLVLQDAGLTDDSALVIASALTRRDCSLRHLNLMANPFTAGGIFAVAAALRVNNSLHAFYYTGVADVEVLQTIERYNFRIRELQCGPAEQSAKVVERNTALWRARQKSALMMIAIRWRRRTPLLSQVPKDVVKLIVAEMMRVPYTSSSSSTSSSVAASLSFAAERSCCIS